MIKKTIVAMCITATLFATTTLDGNKTDKKKEQNKFERGFRFQGMSEEEVNATIRKMAGKRDIAAILEEILKIQKKQLKTQDEILEILQAKFDPKPKKIIVNGKECIENSSADCFNMPLLHPDAKQVPVVREFVSHPSIKSAKEYLRWHAKFLQHSFRAGESLTLAVNQYGAKAYPLNYENYSYSTPGAYTTVLAERSNKMVLNSLEKEVSLYFFFGKNADADTYAIDNYANLIKEIPSIKYHVVFYTAGAKGAFDALASRLKNIQWFKNRAASITVSPETFSKHNIYATPSIGSFIKRKKKLRIVTVGRDSPNSIIGNIVDVLEYDKVLKEGHSPGYETWKRTGDYSKEYYHEQYGVDLNQTLIQELYEKKK